MYRAKDKKLKREVAIKILPDGFSTNPDRLIRFQREAEVLASLNHPNIAAIYDLAAQDQSQFLVLELVGGETLAERIGRGPISVEAALIIAKQIAEALEAAHEKGVIHRDLKPGNIMLTPEGKVKVLDFGLAKALESQAQSNLSNSPTLMTAMSSPGVILGTASYMSPEQAKSKTVDKRTDIFAFGCVLYEMLTSQRAFDGEDVADVLGAILKTEPDWTRLPVDPTSRARDLLGLCLEKNVKNPRSDATDVRLDIELALKDIAGNVATKPTAISTRTGWAATAVLSLALVAVSAAYLRAVPTKPRLLPDRSIAFSTDDGKEAIVWIYELSGAGPPPA